MMDMQALLNMMALAFILLSKCWVILAIDRIGQNTRSTSLRTIQRTGLQMPYRSLKTGQKCWSHWECLIEGALACIDDPQCLSYDRVGEELQFFRNNQCDGGSLALLTRCSCDLGRTYTRSVDICYKVYNTRKKWTEAKIECSNDGGRLLVLETNAQFAWFVEQFEIHDTFWIGARWEGGRMMWLNGKELPMDSSFWHTNEPNDPDGSFVALASWLKNYGLDDQYYETTYKFICEY